MSVTDFTITLERPDGVYRAGEIVRGHVDLTTSKDIQTRGAKIQMTGAFEPECKAHTCGAVIPLLWMPAL